MHKGKSRIRSVSRKGVRSEKVRPVEARVGRPGEGAICERCGALFSRRTWRRDHAVTDSLLAVATWVVCPACQQTEREEYFGRVLIPDAAVAEEDGIRRRIHNVAARAAFTQPERQVVSVERRGEAPRSSHHLARSSRIGLRTS
jgi:NMD protein affecting ribosome stability and mRNA decay